MNFFYFTYCLFFIDYSLTRILHAHNMSLVLSFFCTWTLVTTSFAEVGFLLFLLLLEQQLFIGCLFAESIAFWLSCFFTIIYVRSYLNRTLTFVRIAIPFLGSIGWFSLYIPHKRPYTLAYLFGNIVLNIALTYLSKGKLDNRLKANFSRGKSGLQTKKVP